jgi:ribosome biogenesis GTPase
MNRARVIEEHKTNYILKDGLSEYKATVRGSFFTGGLFPKVGDFVSYTKTSGDKAVIEEVLPRKSVISRKAVGTKGEQVIVANVDMIFIVMGLDGDFNVSRLERYLLLAQEAGVTPVVVLNKSDLVDHPELYVSRIQPSVDNIPIHMVSAITGKNMESLLGYLKNEMTVVLLGSSGAGKSSITNWLLKNHTQNVSEVRTDDSRGRHTTTARQLFSLPCGGYLIDTPGMRELGIVNTAEDESAVFKHIQELSYQCRFSNCDHEQSQGCAIIKALNKGDIDERQIKNYRKLQQERMYEESKHDTDSSHQYKQSKKNLHKGYQKIQKINRSKKGF